MPAASGGWDGRAMCGVAYDAAFRHTISFAHSLKPRMIYFFVINCDNMKLHIFILSYRHTPPSPPFVSFLFHSFCAFNFIIFIYTHFLLNYNL